MKKKLLGLLMLVMCVVLSLGVLAACNNTPEKPEGGSWTCYSENKIWTKNLTLKFEDSETFKVYSGSDQWIEGKYKFAKDPGTSTLTLWNADVAIPGIEKNGEKTYEPVDGVYTIEFDHGSGGKSKFLFQPPQDGTKPGEETNQPKPPCDTHIDANKDGKCDECGADMPKEEAKVQVAMTAKASVEIPNVMTVNADAKLDLYDDNTWVMYIKTDADPSVTDFIVAAKGTFTTDTTTYASTLTVSEQTNANSLPATITVNCDASGYPKLAYNANVAYISNGLTFNFSFSDSEPVKEPMVTLTATKSIEPYPNYTVNAEAKIEIYDDNTWVMYIKTNADPTNLDYQKAASGTYTNTQTEMTLTRTELTVQGSEMAETINVAVNPSGYPAIAYSATVTYTNVMAFEFSFTGTMNMQ